jgi:hypothetical protein
MFSRLPMVAISRGVRKPGPTSMAGSRFRLLAHRLALSSGVWTACSSPPTQSPYHPIDFLRAMLQPTWPRSACACSLVSATVWSVPVSATLCAVGISTLIPAMSLGLSQGGNLAAASGVSGLKDKSRLPVSPPTQDHAGTHAPAVRKPEITTAAVFLNILIAFFLLLEFLLGALIR